MKNSPIVFSFILAALPFLLPVDAVAGMAANAYVTVTRSSGNVILSQDELSFHLSPANTSTIVTVSANKPYILVKPDPDPTTKIARVSLSANERFQWAVKCEDGESSKLAVCGNIGFCQFNFSDIGEPTHEVRPVIVKTDHSEKITSGDGKFRPRESNTVLVSAAVVLVEKGVHKLSIPYEPCPDCGSIPDATVWFATDFDQYLWKKKLVTENEDILFADNGPSILETIKFPPFVVTAFLTVTGKKSDCIKCTDTYGPIEIRIAPKN